MRFKVSPNKPMAPAIHFRCFEKVLKKFKGVAGGQTCWCASALSILQIASPAVETNQIQFNRDIRPILSENCYACHGPDKNQRKAKLRLDVREVALEKEAIVPGKPEKSKIVQHIFSSDPEEIMPPPKTQKTLTLTQKDL